MGTLQRKSFSTEVNAYTVYCFIDPTSGETCCLTEARYKKTRAARNVHRAVISY